MKSLPMSKVQTLQNVFIELALLANFPEVKKISIELNVEVETVIDCIRGQIGDEALMDKIVQASKDRMMEGVKATSEVYTKDVREVCDMLKVATECNQQLLKLFGGLMECFAEIDKRLQSLEQLGNQIIRVQ